MATTANDLGLSLGVALIDSIGVAAYRGAIELPPDVPADVAVSAKDSLDGAVSSVSGLSPELATAVLDQARAAFTRGLNLGAILRP